MSTPVSEETAENTSLTGVTSTGKQKKNQGGAEEAATISSRLAALVVRVQCNQHKQTCTDRTGAECSDRSHRKDADYLNECLAMLGLDGTPPAVTDDDRRNLLKSLRGPRTTPDLSDLLTQGN